MSLCPAACTEPNLRKAVSCVLEALPFSLHGFGSSQSCIVHELDTNSDDAVVADARLGFFLLNT